MNIANVSSQSVLKQYTRDIVIDEFMHYSSFHLEHFLDLHTRTKINYW